LYASVWLFLPKPPIPGENRVSTSLTLALTSPPQIGTSSDGPRVEAGAVGNPEAVVHVEVVELAEPSDPISGAFPMISSTITVSGCNESSNWNIKRTKLG
jgi:hypothetical protein